MRVMFAGRRPLLAASLRVSEMENPSLIIDAADLDFASPLELTSIVALAHDAARNERSITLDLPVQEAVTSYLQRMDVIRRLPRRCRLNGRLPPENRLDHSTVLMEVVPVTQDTAEDVVARMGRLVGDKLGHTGARLMIKAFGELIDNAVSHGESESGAFLAVQAYSGETSGRAGVEAAVSDVGVGVLAHLRRNPEHRSIRSSDEALRLAVRETVTGTTEARGYGLSDAVKSASRCGDAQLMLWSGDAVASAATEGGDVHWSFQPGMSIAGTWAWLRTSVPLNDPNLLQ
jgi:hypothetical protein